MNSSRMDCSIRDCRDSVFSSVFTFIYTTTNVISLCSVRGTLVAASAHSAANHPIFYSV